MLDKAAPCPQPLAPWQWGTVSLTDRASASSTLSEAGRATLLCCCAVCVSVAQYLAARLVRGHALGWVLHPARAQAVTCVAASLRLSEHHRHHHLAAAVVVATGLRLSKPLSQESQES